MTTILYHNDYDGVCAGAIAYRYFKREAQMIVIDYNIPFPFDKISNDEDVWILDYSIPVEDMMALRKITKDIGWIDHHETSVLTTELSDIKGILSTKKSGCELTWNFFYPSQATPWAAKYIGDRDTWQWQYGDGTRHFYNGLQLEKDSMNPMASVWDNLLSMPENHKHVDKLVEKGAVVEQFKLLQNKLLVDTHAYRTLFEGYRTLVMNCSNKIDRLSGEMREREDQLCVLYAFDGTKYTISLYTNNPKIDVSVIAKKYGGGGQKGAAGFVAKVLPSELLSPREV